MTDAPELLPDEVNALVNWGKTRKYMSKDTVAALLAAERKKALEEAVAAIRLYEGVVAKWVLSGKGSVAPTEALEQAAQSIIFLMEKEQGE